MYFPVGPKGPNDAGLSRKHILEGIDASLRRLSTDCVDLYQARRYDVQTPLEETIAAFGHVVRQGKALYIGVSEWTADQLRRGQELARQNGSRSSRINRTTRPCGGSSKTRSFRRRRNSAFPRSSGPPSRRGVTTLAGHDSVIPYPVGYILTRRCTDVRSSSAGPMAKVDGQRAAMTSTSPCGETVWDSDGLRARAPPRRPFDDRFRPTRLGLYGSGRQHDCDKLDLLRVVGIQTVSS